MGKIQKNKDFKTPEGYFDEFTDKLMGKLFEEKRSAPSLNGNQDGFTVPDGYFETLKDKTLVRVSQEEEAKVVRLNPYRKYYLVAASMAAILVLALNIDWFPNKEVAFDSLSASDIDAYFENNELGMSTLELAEVFPTDDLVIGDMMANRLNDENIVDYLHNNIDYVEDLNLHNDD